MASSCLYVQTKLHSCWSWFASWRILLHFFQPLGLKKITTNSTGLAVSGSLTAGQRVLYLDLMLGHIANYCPVVTSNCIIKNYQQLYYKELKFKIDSWWQTIRHSYVRILNIHSGFHWMPWSCSSRLPGISAMFTVYCDFSKMSNGRCGHLSDRGNFCDGDTKKYVRRGMSQQRHLENRRIRIRAIVGSDVFKASCQVSAPSDVNCWRLIDSKISGGASHIAP